MKPFEKSRAGQEVRSPQSLRKISVSLLILFITGIIVTVNVPWQQTVMGTGKVTVYSPMQRPQNLEAPINGRLKKWIVAEGQSVKKGQVIAELEDLDPKFLDINQIIILEEQKRAMVLQKQAAEGRIIALKRQLEALTQSRGAAIPGAAQKIIQNKEKFTAAQQNLDTARFNYNRTKDLYEKGLRSKREYELANLELVKAETGVRQAMAETDSAKFDQAKVSGDTSAAIASVSASISSALETSANIQANIAKLRADIENLKIRTAQRLIKSPINGTVVRLLQLGSGETLSEGEILATIVPDTQDQAVEIFVSAWDVPLISKGRQVRLQFAGWPAIQFSGWPMIATGTFGGRVAVIDAVDDGKGKYRILIKPDIEAIKSKKDQPWPSPKYLRPGAEVQGWILLDTVSLGYELWRRFNAFPISLKSAPEEGKTQN